MGHHRVVLHDGGVFHNSRMFHGGVFHSVMLHGVRHSRRSRSQGRSGCSYRDDGDNRGNSHNFH